MFAITFETIHRQSKQHGSNDNTPRRRRRLNDPADKPDDGRPRERRVKRPWSFIGGGTVIQSVSESVESSREFSEVIVATVIASNAIGIELARLS